MECMYDITLAKQLNNSIILSNHNIICINTFDGVNQATRFNLLLTFFKIAVTSTTKMTSHRNKLIEEYLKCSKTLKVTAIKTVVKNLEFLFIVKLQQQPLVNRRVISAPPLEACASVKHQ